MLFHRLTGGSTSSPDNTIIDVRLELVDVNALKASIFATDSNSTYITIEATAITDNAFTPNEVIPIGSDMALQADAYVTDQTAPALQQYTLDIDSDLLILTFDEPIDPTSVDCGSITLYNTSSSDQAALTLSGCLLSYSEEVAGLIVLTLELERPDITTLKINLNFATSTENTFLSFPRSAFADTAGNAVTAAEFIQVTTFIPDQTRPMLVSFSYDQHLGEISLTFSDVVSASTLDPTAITIQHDVYRSENRTFSPTASTTTSSSDGYIILLELSHFDLLTLKSNTGVARSENDTYITIAGFLIDDTTGIDVVPITDGKALK